MPALLLHRIVVRERRAIVTQQDKDVTFRVRVRDQVLPVTKLVSHDATGMEASLDRGPPPATGAPILLFHRIVAIEGLAVITQQDPHAAFRIGVRDQVLRDT